MWKVFKFSLKDRVKENKDFVDYFLLYHDDGKLNYQFIYPEIIRVIKSKKINHLLAMDWKSLNDVQHFAEVNLENYKHFLRFSQNDNFKKDRKSRLRMNFAFRIISGSNVNINS